MNPSLIFAAVLLSVTGLEAAPKPASNIFESSIPATPAGELDRIVFDKLSSLKIQPVLCSDAAFVRRVHLDVIGTLPTAQEARDFIQDPDVQNKRRLLIDRLLARDEFADYWSMKWGRHSANQGGIPGEPLAERGAGVSPLGPGVDRRKQALRQVRPGNAHL